MPSETDSNKEPMRRITLTFYFDLGLLEVEGKSESSGRLYNGDCRLAKAAAFLESIADQLMANIVSKKPVSLIVDGDNYEVVTS